MLGPEHPDLAVTLNNLAVLCKSQGDYQQAEAMYRRALAILEKAFDPHHPKVISCRKNFAALRRFRAVKKNGSPRLNSSL